MRERGKGEGRGTAGRKHATATRSRKRHLNTQVKQVNMEDAKGRNYYEKVSIYIPKTCRRNKRNP